MYEFYFYSRCGSMDKRPYVKKNEILIIVFILIVSAGCIVYQWKASDKNGDIICELYVDNRLLSRINLNNNGELNIPERERVFLTVRDHAIAFTKSDCPDKICINTGYISHPGQMAVCLPNRVAIRIRSERINIDAPDVVAW